MAIDDDKLVSFKSYKKKLQEQIQSNKAEDITPTGSQNTSRLAEEALVPELARMNEKHAFVHSLGGKPAVFSRVYNEFFDDEIVEFITPDSFMVRYSNQLSPETNDRDKNIPMGKWWMGHPHRKEYETAIFDPTLNAGEINRNGKLIYNTWEGFAIEPKRGVWKHTLRHIYEILCNKDKEKFRYVMKWFAWCVQNPGKQAEVALIFKGKKGAGKGTILTQFRKIFGRHGLVISNREHLTGKHNSHLESSCFLFADEAYKPGDREIEGIIKNLITEPSLTVEPKFRDLKISKNCLHIVMATNDEWVIPATEDERRYFINEVDNKYAKNMCSDAKRDSYFIRLYNELTNGGLEAMLYDLKYMQLGDYHPRYNVPMTKELKKQIHLSLPKIKTAMMYFLEEGIFVGEVNEDEKTKEKKYLITIETLLSYIHHLDEHNYKTISRKNLVNLLGEIGLTSDRINTKRYWIFPELGETRRLWNQRVIECEWDLTTTWQVEKLQF